MNLDRVSYYDLYFFVDMAAPLFRLADAPDLGPWLQTRYGATWLETLVNNSQTYRKGVEAYIREGAETSQALAELYQALGQVSLWRDSLVAAARTLPQDAQPIAMQAAGWGLGSPRGVKATRNLLLTVKARMEQSRATFTSLGVAPAMIDFPQTLLGQIEQLEDELATEKAQDDMSRHKINSLRSELIELYSTIGHALTASIGQATLLGHDSEPLRRLSVGLEKALAESRIQSRKQARAEAVPPELTEGSEVDASHAELAGSAAVSAPL